MGQGQIRVELQRGVKRGFRPVSLLTDIAVAVLGQHPVHSAEAGPGRSVLRIKLDAPLVEVPRGDEPLRVGRTFPDVIGVQVQLIGLRMGGHIVAQRPPVASGEREGQGIHNLPGQFVLQLEDIGELNLRVSRDHDSPGRHLNQLDGDPHLAVRAEERAEEHHIHSGLGGDRLQIGSVSSETRARGRRPHRERLQTGERLGNGLREAGGKELDLGIGPKQAEREHDEPGHGLDPGNRPTVQKGQRLTDFPRHCSRGGIAVCRLLGERPLDDPVGSQHIRPPYQWWRLVLHQCRVDLIDGAPAEGGLAAEHLEQHRAHRENIGRGTQRLAVEGFGRHVPGSSHHGAGARQLDIAGVGPGQPEVEQLCSVRGKEDVRRFEIAVDDSPGVHRLQGAEDSQDSLQCLAQRERPTPDAVGQGLAGEQLHDHEQLAALLGQLVDLADIGVADGRGDPGFPQEPLLERRVGVEAAHPLDGHQAIEALISRLIDHTHAPLAKLSCHPILPDGLKLGAGIQRCCCRGRGPLEPAEHGVEITIPRATMRGPASGTGRGRAHLTGSTYSATFLENA